MSPQINGRRLLAILFIFCCAAAAWFALGASLVHRSEVSDSRLTPEIERLWGGRHQQQAPTVTWHERRIVLDRVTSSGPDRQPVAREVERRLVFEEPLALLSSRLEVDLDLEHRRRGLLWYDVYTVDFRGLYDVEIPAGEAGTVRVRVPLPAVNAMYDGFQVRIGGEPARPTQVADGVTVEAEVDSGRRLPIEIAYRSRGLDRWSYHFEESGGVAQVRDFDLAMTTDFAGFDFPDGGLSPTTKAAIDGGWALGWRFDSLLTGKRIGLDLPNRLNPGPLAARITFFAPVSLLFFVTVLVILGILRRRNLHPMHYFFLSAAFFAFHLLLAYLVDHLDVHAAFLLASAVSVFLVVSYLRVVGGDRFAFREAGLAQVVYLVLFNYAFFFEGYTGLTVTVGAVITLFVLMRLTAPVDWNRALGSAEAPAAELTP